MDGHGAQRPPASSSKHCCKVCNKRFSNGRSLGGHMRSHVGEAAGSSPETEERLQSSYGLRENPKKTWRWRLSDSSEDARGGRTCGECGMEFHSSRARCGHMRSHSDRRQRSAPGKLEELEGPPGNAVGFLGQYDGGVRAATVPRTKKRSKRIPPSTNDEENAAENLMLLSEGVRSWGSSSSESSDKDSMDLATNEHLVTRKGFKKGDSDASINSVAEEDDPEFKKPRHDFSGTDGLLEQLPEDPEKGLLEVVDPRSSANNLSTKLELDGSGSEAGNRHSMKMESLEAKVEADFVNSFHTDATETRSQFKCSACDRTFRSYQALGGHRASRHKKMNGCTGRRTGGNECNVDSEASVDQTGIKEVSNCSADGTHETMHHGSPPKKSKGHVCTLCGKAFRSGQALGGHKRSHLVQRSAAGGNDDFGAADQNRPLDMSEVIDLNLPASEEGDPGRSTVGEVNELKPWWTGSNLMYEPVVV